MTQYSDARQQGILPVQHSFLVDTMSQHSHTSGEKDVIRQKLVQALKSEHALVMPAITILFAVGENRVEIICNKG